MGRLVFMEKPPTPSTLTCQREGGGGRRSLAGLRLGQTLFAGTLRSLKATKGSSEGRTSLQGDLAQNLFAGGWRGLRGFHVVPPSLSDSLIIGTLGLEVKRGRACV